MILYGINKQDNYALVHKKATIERREICPWSLSRVLSRDCPNHPNGVYVHSLSLSLPSSAVKILLCLLLIGFIPVCKIGLVGDFVINIPECILRFRCIFLGVHVLSNFLRHSDNCGYLLPSAFATSIAYPPSPQLMLRINRRQDGALMFYCVLGEPYTAKGSPRLLAIWGLGGPHMSHISSPPSSL